MFHECWNRLYVRNNKTNFHQFLAEKASSGLWENVTLTKTSGYHRWHQFMSNVQNWCQGPLYTGYSQPCHLHCPKQVTAGPPTPHRTSMSILQIITLLQMCLKNTSIIFQGKYFEQAHGVVMGSPISLLITNLEEFKALPLNPQLWLRYVDDTFVIQQADHCHPFLQHINYLDPHIQLTMEKPKCDGSISFLDKHLSPQDPTTPTQHQPKKTHPHRSIPLLDSSHNLQQNTLCTILWHIGQGCSVQTNKYSNKKMTTLGSHYSDTFIPHGY